MLIRRAFIEFESEEDAEAAIKAHQGVEIEGFELFLDYVGEKRKMFSSKSKHQCSLSVFICSWTNLKILFQNWPSDWARSKKFLCLSLYIFFFFQILLGQVDKTSEPIVCHMALAGTLQSTYFLFLTKLNKLTIRLKTPVLSDK